MNVAAARPADVPLRHVAAALGLDRSAFYPRPPTASPTTALAAGQPRALSAVERQQTLDLLHSERFCDQAPRQVHATCLSEGLLVASWSTMYRLLRAGGESQERRGIRPPQRHADAFVDTHQTEVGCPPRSDALQRRQQRERESSPCARGAFPATHQIEVARPPLCRRLPGHPPN